MSNQMNHVEKVRELMDGASTAVVVKAAKHFEALWRDNPDDVGVRRVYFGLDVLVSRLYPVKRPKWVEPPEEAWGSIEHPFWSSDPASLWEEAYEQLRRSRFPKDSIGLRVHVSQLQSLGLDVVEEVTAQ